mmetsp:Transcript_26294/g.52393  ORF Transcript_26294/g.52393 Transcript_26294/m.52393 type:complete len:241 (+) Transcript_26294:762-1484(+)
MRARQSVSKSGIKKGISRRQYQGIRRLFFDRANVFLLSSFFVAFPGWVFWLPSLVFFQRSVRAYAFFRRAISCSFLHTFCLFLHIGTAGGFLIIFLRRRCLRPPNSVNRNIQKIILKISLLGNPVPVARQLQYFLCDPPFYTTDSATRQILRIQTSFPCMQSIYFLQEQRLHVLVRQLYIGSLEMEFVWLTWQCLRGMSVSAPPLTVYYCAKLPQSFMCVFIFMKSLQVPEFNVPWNIYF